MKAEPFLLVSTLDVIIGQRLVRKLGEHKEKFNLSEGEISRLQEVVDLDKVITALKNEGIVSKDSTIKTIPFYRPVTQTQDDDGYKGRVGIYEVLKLTPTIRELIMKSATPKQIEEQAKKEGMLTMLEDGIFKAVQGVTTIEEVLRVVTE
jgi:type II secretory ATPase GspE/PulE/Tfp pilus assembly ATPase PilB-like protein